MANNSTMQGGNYATNCFFPVSSNSADQSNENKKGKSKLSGKKKERMKTKGRATTVENSESPNPFDLKCFFHPRDTDPLPRPAEQKENFRIFAEEATKAGIDKLLDQFNRNVQIYKTRSKKHIAYEANKSKNRYNGELAVD
ncbi:hypothetical protein WR25_04912 [Diploscapter pachys]|uniref:Uncharacterized protein n=1 Tax=Diploscapter pachys TaxID=2018661 RepID=A0A2A2LAN0_9BILA|nr:hypothetical protein WR25_04912 [Diploscapter pachys]